MSKFLYSIDAFPLGNRAVQLRIKHNKSLLDSLNHLLEVCEEVIPYNLFISVKEKINRLNPELKFSGFMSLLHEMLYKAVKDKNVKEIVAILSRLLDEKSSVSDIHYLNLSDLDEFYSLPIKEICSKELERNVTFYPLTVKDFEKAKERIQQGFIVLKHSFKDFFEETQELVSEILFLNSVGIQAGSSADLFGMIHRNHIYKAEKITDILDYLIHEESHLYIHLLVNDDPLVLNPLERYESPLRKTKRPLMGIYHATFVLARIIYVLRKAFEINEIPESEKKYCHELIDHYVARCQVGFEVLEKHAKLTALGSKLIISAKELIQPL